MKILAIGCLHGKIPKKIKKYAKDVDVIISPGDLSDRKERKYIFKYMDQLNMGLPLSDFVPKRKLTKFFRENLKSMEYVINELDKLGKPVYVVPGNNDFTELRIKKKVLQAYGLRGKYKTMQEMIKKTKNLKLMFHSRINLGEFDLIGFSLYSFLIDPLKSLKRKFSKSKRRKTVFMTHNVPYGTKLDKVNNKSSPMHGKHVGERFYNLVVKKYKPTLHVCGHIHETQGKIRMGKTTVVNTGYGRAGQFALIDIGKNIKIKFFK